MARPAAIDIMLLIFFLSFPFIPRNLLPANIIIQSGLVGKTGRRTICGAGADPGRRGPPEEPDALAGEDSLTMEEVYQQRKNEKRNKTEKYRSISFRKEEKCGTAGTGGFSKIRKSQNPENWTKQRICVYSYRRVFYKATERV